MIIDGVDKGDVWKDEKHCVPIEDFIGNVKKVLAADYPKLPKRKAGPGTDADGLIEQPCTIVGFGPTLRWTWREINVRPICTVSGAHDFLIKRGVVPDYHVECDPRPHKAEMLTPHKDVKYLIASNCHPELFAKLGGFNVTIWHASESTDTIDNYVKEHDPDTAMCGFGSNAGFRAMEVMGQLGHWHLPLYGIDCSGSEARMHAGRHSGIRKPLIKVKICGREFWSTIELASSAEYFGQCLAAFKFDPQPHGDSLLTTLVNDVKGQLDRLRSVQNYGNLSYQWAPQGPSEQVTSEMRW